MGKRNVLYRLHMPDDTLWMVRLHNPLVQKSTVTDLNIWASNDRLLIESEMATMRYVRQHTAIPVPEIYGFDFSYENPLASPYVFMAYINEKPFPFPFQQRGCIHDRDILKIHPQLVNFNW